MIEQRVSRLRSHMESSQIDGVLLMQPENLRYFSGFTGGEGALLVTDGTAELWTDSRYTEQAAEQSGQWFTVKNHEGRLYEAVRNSIKAHSRQIIGYEGAFLTHEAYNKIFDGLEDCSSEGMDVTVLRSVKDEEELENTRQASRIADKAFAEILPLIRPGVTERYLAARLESSMLLQGSEEKSFTTIVASGARSAMPHGTATDKVIEAGDFITFDFGAVYKGYHSDMTRTVVAGRASQDQKDLYDIVLQAQTMGVQAIKAGLSCHEADGMVRNFFKVLGVEAYFTHSLGHGTGLEIHEQPVLSPRAEGVLQENMIVTVEPGLYIEGKYGVRIEDSVAVTADGCEILTNTPKLFMELQ